MGARQTSIDCYNQIKAEGLLTKRRLQVYEAILRNAPCTSSEAMKGTLKWKKCFITIKSEIYRAKRIRSYLRKRRKKM